MFRGLPLLTGFGKRVHRRALWMGLRASGGVSFLAYALCDYGHIKFWSVRLSAVYCRRWIQGHRIFPSWPNSRFRKIDDCRRAPVLTDQSAGKGSARRQALKECLYPHFDDRCDRESDAGSTSVLTQQIPIRRQGSPQNFSQSHWIAQ
jgi:hypothetical protein